MSILESVSNTNYIDSEYVNEIYNNDETYNLSLVGVKIDEIEKLVEKNKNKIKELEKKGYKNVKFSQLPAGTKIVSTIMRKIVTAYTMVLPIRFATTGDMKVKGYNCYYVKSKTTGLYCNVYIPMMKDKENIELIRIVGSAISL